MSLIHPKKWSVKFTIAVILFFTFSSVSCLADSPISDSLALLLDVQKNDTSRVKTLNALAFELRDTDSDKAAVYATKAQVLAAKLNYKQGEATSLNMIGLLSQKKGDYPLAEEYYLKALEIRKRASSPRDVASTYNNLGIVQKRLGDFHKAKDYYQQGLSTLEGTPPVKLEAILLNNLGAVYKNLGDYEEAIRHIDRGILVREKFKDGLGKARSMQNLTNLYRKLGNNEKANEYQKKSLAIFEEYQDQKGMGRCYINLGMYATDHEIALEYFEKAHNYRNALEISDLMLVLRGRGDIYREQKQYEKALENYLTSLKKLTELQSKSELAEVNHDIGLIYIKKDEHQKALKYLKNSQVLLEEVPDLLLKSEVYSSLSETYGKLGQYNMAFKMNVRHNDFRDSLHTAYRDAMNTKLNYEDERKKLEIKEKDRQLELAAANREKLKARSLAALSLLAFVLIFALLLAYRNQQRRLLAENGEKIALQKEEIAREKMDNLLNELELTSTYAKLEGQDNERRRIAQDLHDRLGSMLATIRLYFNSAMPKKGELNTEQQSRMKMANDLLDNASQEVRRIAYDMQSGVLTNFGLKAELDALAETIQNANQMNIEVKAKGLEERLDHILEVKIYRIVQELVSNALKHAKATKIGIFINRSTADIVVKVEDNGVGFDPNKKRKRVGMGLKNVESRAFDLKGKLNIDTELGRGTSISVEIPHPLGKGSA